MAMKPVQTWFRYGSNTIHNNSRIVQVVAEWSRQYNNTSYQTEYNFIYIYILVATLNITSPRLKPARPCFVISFRIWTRFGRVKSSWFFIFSHHSLIHTYVLPGLLNLHKFVYFVTCLS